ncbi:MAG TPA: TonB-dependent receptor [Vicinamibacteria bacterium]|nr:TonB-dependent receptor [Vicinamibacteria bacterium]
MSRPRTRAWAVVTAFALGALPALGQSSEGRISGTIRDALGAAVPGVALTLINQATNASQTATSSTDGTYSASVPPGVYSVAAALKGFARQTRKDLKVEAGATVTVDFALETRLEEEVTVTALKRESSLIETPLSVAAPTEDELRSWGVQDIEGVAAHVGGMTVQNLGPGQSQVAMRGISAGQIVRDQPGVKEQVGVYLDESVISLSLFTPDLDLFDVRRVEVLRGPQGTLFGSGSLSGTVRYISNPPEMGVRKGVFEFGGSAIDGGSLGGDFKLALNTPLGDKASARIVGYYDHLPGFIDAVTPNLSTDEDVNTGQRFGGRAAIAIAASDRLTVTPRIVYQRVKMDGWNREDAFNILANPYTTTRPPVTLGERQEFNQLDEEYTDDFVLGDLNINYNFGSAQLTSISSYTYRDVLVIRDTTSLTASVTGGNIGLPESVYTIDSPLYDATTAKVFTEELRVAGTRDRFEWVLGGFYSHTSRDYGQDLRTIGFEDATGIPTEGVVAPKDSLFYSDLGYKLDQFALFGEGTFSVTDRLSITGGLRYYNFSEDKEQIFDGFFVGYVSQPGTTEADGVAPRLILNYKVSESTNLNAQVSKGFRLGGINDPLNEPICTPADLVTFSGRDQWKDETVWNYEIGAKSRLAGGRGQLSLAAFYMDIKDLQATVTAGSCSSRLIFNVPDSRSQGIEGEFSFAPSRHFDFALSGSYNDSELQSTVEPGSVTGIVAGRRLPTVPEFQMAVAATGQWDWTSSALGYATMSLSYVGGDRYTQVGDLELGRLNMDSFAPNTIGGPLTQQFLDYETLLPSYTIVNARIGVVKGKWDVALYANNLTDEHALLAFDRERGTRARIFYLTNQPRTFGLTARVNF